MKRLFLVTLLAIILAPELVDSVAAQTVVDGVDMVYPRDFSANYLCRELALLNPQSPVDNIIKIDRSVIIRVVRFQQEVLKAETENLEVKLNNIEKRLSETEDRSQICEHEIEAVMEQAHKESGLPVINQSTTDLLLQNCLVELQRLQWEIASEKELTKQENAKPDTRVAESQLLAQRAQLESIRRQENVISAKLERVTKLHSSGLANTDEIEEAKQKLEAEHARVAMAEAALVEAQAKLESLKAPSSSDSATKLVQLTAREEAVLKQVEQVKKQRSAHEAASRLRSRMHQLQSRAAQLSEQLNDAELQKLERDSMLRNIEAALKKYEESEKPKPPAEDPTAK